MRWGSSLNEPEARAPDPHVVARPDRRGVTHPGAVHVRSIARREIAKLPTGSRLRQDRVVTGDGLVADDALAVARPAEHDTSVGREREARGRRSSPRVGAPRHGLGGHVGDASEEAVERSRLRKVGHERTELALRARREEQVESLGEGVEREPILGAGVLEATDDVIPFSS